MGKLRVLIAAVATVLTSCGSTGASSSASADQATTTTGEVKVTSETTPPTWLRARSDAAYSVCNQLLPSMDGPISKSEASQILAVANEDGVPLADIREKCGDSIDSLMYSGGGGSLESGVDLQDFDCAREMTGTLINDNDVAVDVVLRWELLTDTDLRVGDGLVFVDSIEPGQTVKWDDYILDIDPDATKCHVEVDSVRAS